MSMSTLSAVAIQRDKGKPQRVKGKPETEAETKETEASGYFDLLVSAIPTEPLALYTFLIAGIVATIDTGEDQRLTMRWIIYAAMVLFIVLWLAASYIRRPKADRKRILSVRRGPLGGCRVRRLGTGDA